jgi:hypothetical protein
MNMLGPQAYQMCWHIIIGKGKEVKGKSSKEIFIL